MRMIQIHFYLSTVLLLAASQLAYADSKYFKTRTEVLQIEMEGEPAIQATLRIPEGCSDKAKFPVVILFGGFQEAAQVLDFVHPKKPMILASFDYPYKGSRKFRFPDTLLEGGKLKKFVKNTQTAISRLIPVLKKRSDIDLDKIAIVGASFGAPFAIRAASEHEDLNALIIVHGFGDVQGVIRYRLDRRWSEKLGYFSDWLASLSAWVIVRFLDLPLPEKDAEKLHRSQIALMVEATGDTLIPTQSRDVLWDALARSPAQTKRIQMPGDHLRPGTDILIEKIMDYSLDWLKQMGWFKPPIHCG